MQSSKPARRVRNSALDAVREAIRETTQSDPQTLPLDCKLGQDMGLNRMQIQLILFHAAQDLGLAVSFENCRVNDSSARQIVNLIEHWQSAAGSRAA